MQTETKERCKMVSVESPYRSDDPVVQHGNIAYAILAAKNSARVHGEAPFASHIMLTQSVSVEGVISYVSDSVSDDLGVGRDKAIDITNEARRRSDLIVLYTDRGISTGMKIAVEIVNELNIPVEYRTLDADELSRVLAAEDLYKDRIVNKHTTP